MSEVQDHIVEQILNRIVMNVIAVRKVVILRFRIRAEDYVQPRGKTGKRFIYTGYLIHLDIILQACYGHFYAMGIIVQVLLLSHKAYFIVGIDQTE